MSQTTRKEILERLRRRYRTAELKHKRKLLDQAQELLGFEAKIDLDEGIRRAADFYGKLNAPRLETV